MEQVSELQMRRVDLEARLVNSQSHERELAQALRALETQLEEMNRINENNVEMHAHTHGLAMYAICMLQREVNRLGANVRQWHDMADSLGDLLNEDRPASQNQQDWVHQIPIRNPAETD